MAEWTHNICDMCWSIYYEEERGEPFRLIGDARHKEWCCFCRDLNEDGIFIRKNPQEMSCADLHENPYEEGSNGN